MARRVVDAHARNGRAAPRAAGACVQAVDPLMHELESYTEPLLVVSHQATLRILYSYLVGIPRADAPKIEIPLHNVIKITWDGWRNFEEVRIPYDDGKVPDLQKDGQKDV